MRAHAQLRSLTKHPVQCLCSNMQYIGASVRAAQSRIPQPRLLVSTRRVLLPLYHHIVARLYVTTCGVQSPPFVPAAHMTLGKRFHAMPFVNTRDELPTEHWED